MATACLAGYPEPCPKPVSTATATWLSLNPWPQSLQAKPLLLAAFYQPPIGATQSPPPNCPSQLQLAKVVDLTVQLARLLSRLVSAAERLLSGPQPPLSRDPMTCRSHSRTTIAPHRSTLEQPRAHFAAQRQPTPRWPIYPPAPLTLTHLGGGLLLPGTMLAHLPELPPPIAASASPRRVAASMQHTQTQI